MVTGVLLITFDAVSVASVNDTQTPGPLSGGLDSDILWRGRGGPPLVIICGNSIPHADGVMQTELDIIARPARMQLLDRVESVSHEG